MLRVALILLLTLNLNGFTNHLIDQDSPYLLEHAHNLVNWYPWSKEAFDRAKRENKLIFLSIGYSTCHWCHVMAKESFNDKDVAKVLNDNYISIKVDREEMPGVDKYFQDVFYIMNGRGGGWPLTIILTPDAKPIFSATYLPKESRYQRAGLLDTLRYFANLKRNNYKEIQKRASLVQKYLKILKLSQSYKKGSIDSSISKRFIEAISKEFDRENKGIGVAPKFPHALVIKSLLYIYKLDKNKEALKMATDMLDAMARGGIYDQIEGGFFRYSTDEMWQIPHFEKMLYTNAELLYDYALAYEITDKKLYKQVVKELVAFLNKRFRSNGLFFSALDADSLNPKTDKKEEGYYYTYTYTEAKEALKGAGLENYREILNYFGVTKEGNFKSRNHLFIDEPNLKIKNLKEAKEALLKLRAKRAYPFMDKKILTSWNALLIKALFKASIIDKSYKDLALNSLDTLLNSLYLDKELYHQILPAKSPKVKANFEDYSLLISALISAYESSFNNRYLLLADTLTKEAIKRFYINKRWYLAIKPFMVEASLYDNAYSGALPVMIDNLLKLSLLKENLEYYSLAKDEIRKGANLISKYPDNFPQATLDAIAYKRGFIVLKSDVDKLIKLRGDIKRVTTYPFILYKATKDKLYLACLIDSCFAYSKDEKEFIEMVLKRVGDSK